MVYHKSRTPTGIALRLVIICLLSMAGHSLAFSARPQPVAVFRHYLPTFSSSSSVSSMPCIRASPQATSRLSPLSSLSPITTKRHYSTSLQASPISSSISDDDDEEGEPNILEKFASLFSTKAATKVSQKYQKIAPITQKTGLLTLFRVGIPSILSGILAFYAFPALSLWLCSFWNDAGVFAVLSQDSSQFVQNFLTVAGLLFSILVGQTYYFMYQQQEMVYYALFSEVTEAKSLLEQVALVCQGRTMYPKVLSAISKYVKTDLKKLSADPAVLLSARPVDDPLETIMYLTSVGVPGTVYDTVRSLRQARAQRLGALQRKLPTVHMLLLWILAAIELVSFPLLGAGTQSIGGYNILTIEGCLFGVMTASIVLTLRVVAELWRPAGGAYNVDKVLKTMVSGLEEELKARMSGKKLDNMKESYPSPAKTIDGDYLGRASDRISKQNP
ncbi:unnamed protein product [Cylindrotheca closterium]|uniref:Uncharacterized protein n=1 Tax=Cylindrotheca closterium TaxID=2856 RepID=A0AAD2CKA0_9STRA|nr:unnamed protein product [Cylindrotheca closterium]